MRYKSFRIRNFKGIQDTTINLQGVAGASVFAFVGLNESGKTTILQAIHSFSPDSATSELLSGEKDIGVPYADRVPRHQIASFTGDVSVEATLIASDDDIEDIKKSCVERGIIIGDIPREFTIERHQTFESGDYKENYLTLRTSLSLKTKRQKKFREPNSEEQIIIRDIIYNLTPDIAFFPTLVFDFPDQIYLTNRGDNISKFYRSVFKDVLSFEGNDLNIQNHIIDRIRRKEYTVPWIIFFPIWSASDERKKINHVMDRAGVALTNLVFGKWNQIFGKNENVKGKEITIEWATDEGKETNEAGQLVSTEEHDVSITFQIKDGTRRFDVNDRSLGFRWFFAFMLFTQVRAMRSGSRPVLFLFDEPASNLHAAAQQRLIDSFPEIAVGEHALAYTTHSHYMIEPKWLEQTFIVTNRSDTPSDSVIDNVSLEDESLDIKATPYRSFVNDNPSKVTYFQPILDRLQIIPSKFDLQKPSLVVEGKSDYYILRYAIKLLELNGFSILPCSGASTMGALASFHVGWGLEFIFLLDSDKTGKSEKEKYVKDYGVSSDHICELEEFDNSLKEIEDILDEEAQKIISKTLDKAKLTKSDYTRFFQEKLASDEVINLGTHFENKAKTLLNELKLKFNRG